ncbi:hypothetical protein QL285_013476 [Trifolium repens]|nr:hypothetical protein QL285_013476 [Trifolium repens]
MDNSHVQLNDQEHETLQFCTQDGLETINLDEEVGTTSVVNTLKTRFQPKEDELLIQSWLNVSTDSIVGNDKKGDSFWKRIGEAYNDNRPKNFPERKSTTLKGRWHKKINHGKPTVMLEAVASQDLWIWHAFFGVVGSNNDINVLNQSDVYNDVMQGRAPEVHYSVNGHEYNMCDVVFYLIYLFF